MKKWILFFMIFTSMIYISHACLSSESIKDIMKDCAKNALSFSLIRDEDKLAIDEELFENKFSYLMEKRVGKTEIKKQRTYYFYFLNQKKCNKNEGNEVKICYLYTQLMKGKQQEIYAKIIFE